MRGAQEVEPADRRLPELDARRTNVAIAEVDHHDSSMVAIVRDRRRRSRLRAQEGRNAATDDDEEGDDGAPCAHD
jgi:hypothetical protein